MTARRRAPNIDAIFGALADPTRRRILGRLRRGEASAGDIASGFRVSRPAISRHVRLLREAKLVRERRDGRQRMYTLNDEALFAVDAWLEEYRAGWRQRLLRLKLHAEKPAK